jgi:anti-sigma factor RsiW
MLCQHYKDSLMEAAASGAAPQGAVRAHLAECASCREAFAQEQSLFGAIDSGLHTAANAEVPPSLLPRVRARLDETATVARFRWVQPLIFASSSLALLFVFFLVALPHRTGSDDRAKRAPVVSVPMTTEPSISGKIPPKDTQTVTAAASHSHASRNSTIVHSAASSNPEVLVPPDERKVLARFVARLNERSDLATALFARAPEKKDALIVVERLQIAALEIKPLEGAGTEISNGAGETR